MEVEVGDQGDPRDQQAMQNAQKAAAFFSQAGLSRLTAKLLDKYIEVGQVGGQVILPDCTANERRDIASFLGKRLYPDTTIRVRLADVERALKHSFNCTLPAMLKAYFPDRALLTRADQRAIRIARQAQFRSALVAFATELPEGSRGQEWLQHGLHGQEWLFSRYKNAPEEEQERQLGQIRYIARLLDQLPSPDAPERLALFAQRTSGDPHTLDPGRATGRLFLLALADLTRMQQQGHGEGRDLYGKQTEDIGEALPDVDMLSIPVTPQDRTQELRLYSNGGLLVDTISSNVAVFNLGGATYRDSTPDPLPQVAGERVLLLPLRQLLEWQSAVPKQADIYVVENPQVFEELIAGLGFDRALPTLVCTSGWPSVAALRLLDLLLAASPNHCLHYSGDFDIKGVQIAAALMTRYAGRCYPWHFDSGSYEVALQADGVPARPGELDMLSRLPRDFAPLVAMMQEKKVWAYQEGITQLLIDDVRKYAMQETEESKFSERYE
jgi:uncharacterized protein (TIGR02679 family)